VEKTELESRGVNQLVINCELWQDMRLCAEQEPPFAQPIQRDFGIETEARTKAAASEIPIANRK
jgi:hypothetical protein